MILLEAARIYSYLLFHLLVEGGSIALALALLALLWNTREAKGNGFLWVIGAGGFAAAALDAVHALAYKGMNVIPGYDANLPTQLWIAARSIQALSLLAAPAALGRQPKLRWLLTGSLALALLAAVAIFTGHFPDCYQEGRGLTRFKILAEYAIVAALLLALVRIRRLGPALAPATSSLIQASTVCAILAEACFTAYVGVYDYANMAGHLFKVAAYYLSYRALFVTAVQDPFDTLLRELRRSQEALNRAQGAAIARLVRLYDALSQVNQAIVKSGSEEALLKRVCRVLVEHGQFLMAWIGWDDPETGWFTLAARAGDLGGYLEQVSGHRGAGPWERLPCMRALRTGLPCVDSGLDAVPADLREAVRAAGFQSQAALPIHRQGRPAGVLSVYAARRDFFGKEELLLLQEAASDLSFALDHLELEAQRRRGEEALRASEEKFSKMFHSAPLLIALARLEDGRLVDMNETFCRTIGYAWEEMAGRTTVELGLLTREERAQLVQAVRRQGWVRNQDSTLRLRDGRQIPVLLTGGIIDLHGEPMLILIGNDLTEIRQSERERRLLQEEVEHMQKMEGLGRLAGGIAHDMNNVLGAILAMTQTLKAGSQLQADLRQGLETIEKASVRGRDLVQGLTVFSRRELASRQPIDPNELVRQEMALLDHTFMKKFELRLDLEDPLDPVLGEPSLLGSALTNLCLNAADAMPQGGTLTLRTRRINDSFIEIEVEDTGEGMGPEVLSRAMEPFFTTKPMGKGTGLGLSIAFNTAHNHGGGLTLQSQPGRGTRARLRLPTVPPEAVPAPAPRAAEAPLAPVDILLVDDDELLRGAVADMIRLLGHRVREADGGVPALNAVARGPVPDLVVLDLNMPGMHGLEVLRRLRAGNPDLPVLLATGSLDGSVEDALARDPRTLAIAKPFSLDQLQAKLARALGAGQASPDRSRSGCSGG